MEEGCHARLGCAVLAGLILVAGGGCSPDTDGLQTRVVSPEEIRVVGTSDAIAYIEDILPVADGAAWVLTSTDPFLVLLSGEGEELRTTGARGGGPGELSWPTTLARDPATEAVVVFDAALGRLLPVDAQAPDSPTFSRASGPIRLNSYEYLWTNNGGRTWIQGTTRGFVFAEPQLGIPWIPAFWSTEVVRLRPDGETEHIVSTANLVGDPSSRFPGAERFLPYPMWTACPDESLAVYDPNANLLRRLSPDGVELSQHELPPERRELMDAERVFSTVYPGVLRNRLMVDAPGREVLYDAFRRDYTARATEFSDVFPEYAHLTCSRPDTLWLQVFDSSQGQLGRGPRWLKIQGDGDVETVLFPQNFRPMRFQDGRIWGTHIGEFDVEYVAWTELGDR